MAAGPEGGIAQGPGGQTAGPQTRALRAMQGLDARGWQLLILRGWEGSEKQ